MSKPGLLTSMATLIALTVFAAACSTDDGAIPTPNVFQTIATVQRSEDPDVPPLPIIRLISDGGSRDGDRGSFCWPQVGGVALCADSIILAGPPPPIGVSRGEGLTVEIEAHTTPVLLNANVFEVGTTSLVDNITLEPSLTTELHLDFDPGVYTVTINGGWDEGDIFYAFQVEVR